MAEVLGGRGNDRKKIKVRDGAKGRLEKEEKGEGKNGRWGR